MLPKSRRIPRELFKTLLLSRNFVNSKHFSLRIAPSESASVSVSVSKKVSKKAVVRNKVRRRVYSAIRPLLPSLKPNLYLFIAKPGAEKVKGMLLIDELKTLL